MGDAEAWLLRACWSLLLSEQPRLSEKIDNLNCLIIIFSFFVYPRSTYLIVSLVNFLVPPSYLVPLYHVAHLPCLPPCTSMRGVSPPVPVLTATRGFHHLIHKTQQGVHKGTNMNKIYSRLGWSLTAIYFAPSLLPSPVKIFEATTTLSLSFVAVPKTNPNTSPKN